LKYLQEYSRNINDNQVKLALAQAIEDTQEAIARVASRLRQLDQPSGQVLNEQDEKLVRQARTRRGVADKLRFVKQGLKFQLEWYEARLKDLADDADAQAIFAALAEQTRVRLERWNNLMKDMKVPAE
jgi:penicillin V acylase-like amidase (Ntn superfamily)